MRESSHIGKARMIISQDTPNHRRSNHRRFLAFRDAERNPERRKRNVSISSSNRIEDVIFQTKLRALQILPSCSAFIYIILRALHGVHVCMNGFNADVYRLLKRRSAFFSSPFTLDALTKHSQNRGCSCERITLARLTILSSL